MAHGHAFTSRGVRGGDDGAVRGPCEAAERQGEGGGRDRVRLAWLEAGRDAGRGGVSGVHWHRKLLHAG